MTPKRIQREKPILFSGPMVKAILNGEKTQTRRVVKIGEPFGKYPIIEIHGPHEGFRGETNVTHKWSADHQTEHAICVSQGFKCPYGQPGDRLWVRETWKTEFVYDDDIGVKFRGVRYLAPGTLGESCGECRVVNGHPKFDLQAWERYHRNNKWRPSIHMPRWASRITLEVTDVRVERVQSISPADCKAEGIKKGFTDVSSHLIDNFHKLWDSINAKRGFDWKSNPWVWCVSFKLLELPHGGAIA